MRAEPLNPICDTKRWTKIIPESPQNRNLTFQRTLKVVTNASKVISALTMNKYELIISPEIRNPRERRDFYMSYVLFLTLHTFSFFNVCYYALLRQQSFSLQRTSLLLVPTLTYKLRV